MWPQLDKLEYKWALSKHDQQKFSVLKLWPSWKVVNKNSPLPNPKPSEITLSKVCIISTTYQQAMTGIKKQDTSGPRFTTPLNIPLNIPVTTLQSVIGWKVFWWLSTIPWLWVGVPDHLGQHLHVSDCDSQW